MGHIKKLVIQGFKSFARKTEIPFENAMNIIVGPNGSGKSARWDTEVLLASGDKKPIGEIVEESLKHAKTNQEIDDGIITKENPLGIRVLSINPKSMKIEESKITAFMKRDGEPNLFTIKTNTGKEVTTTACHPVMIYRNGEVVSEIVENLKQGDLIATPNKINLVENSLKIAISGLVDKKSNSEEFSRFLGYIIGDGCIIKNSGIDFVNADEEILTDYRDVVNFLGFKVSIAKRKNTIAKNGYLYSKDFANNLIDFFNNNYKKEKKHIPKEILFGNKNILANLLAALFDCDSSIRKDNPTFEYVTMSNELAENVIFALLRFGIVARKTKKMEYAANTLLKTKKEYFLISVEGKEKISQLYNHIHLRCIHKRELLKKWSENPIVCNTNNDLLPLEVNKEIKKLFQLCGIKIKPLKKEYPLLAAYTENRCNASRTGLKRIIPLIEEKKELLLEKYNSISLNQSDLVNSMIQLNISGQRASKEIGLSSPIIMRDWASQKFKAKPENLKKFYNFIKCLFEERLINIDSILNTLKNLANSDIFWDKIKKIEKVKGEEFVYDLEVENNHNFIANNIFVHNSNIADALCFVLGRMSIKSIRAAKAANLLFSGNKNYKGVNEAYVELVFDNADGAFSINSTEVSIKRVVRRNGLSIYKINNETKTRQELIELIAQAGIDPNGFNIVLQGDITSFVKMGPDERRKVIEEVAGISIYETRKVKSIHELEKTEEKLKEVAAVLREKNAYLKNLEKDRLDALNYQKIEQLMKRCKATVLSKTIKEKEKEIWAIEKVLENNRKEIDDRKLKIRNKESEIRTLQEKINEVNKNIQLSTGQEQETLHKEISELKSILGGTMARKENFENRIDQNREKETSLKEKIKELESEIQKMRGASPEIKKQQGALKEIQDKFDILEKQRRTFYVIKSELSTLENKKEEKNRLIIGYNKELEIIEKNINQIFSEIKYEKSISSLSALKEKTISERISLKEKRISIEQEILELEKTNAILIQTVTRERKLKGDIIGLDVCPMCRNKITEEHRCYVVDSSNSKIKNADEEIIKNNEKKKQLSEEMSAIAEKMSSGEQRQREIEIDLIKIRNAEEKKENIKRIVINKKEAEESLAEMSSKINELRSKFEELKNVEEKYEDTRLKIQEFSLIDVDVDTNVALKQRELERIKSELKTIARDTEETQIELKTITEKLQESEKILNKKESEEEKLYEKFQKLYTDRNELQDQQKAVETSVMGLQHEIRSFEEKAGSINIQKAQHQAQVENFRFEFKDFETIEQVSMTIEQAREKIQESQIRLSQLGTINLKAVEIYDQVKNACDQITEKMNTIVQEKEKIAQIIAEIDKKKKKSFVKTLDALNALFTRNFSQLSKKGEVFLDVENKEDPFAGGLSIIIKVGKGKYFDISSLSGGEKTLVALSLIFAIQEHKPYCFYIFDEIDAALDKHNSELLAALIKRYMLMGQYIIITHNDALISEATTLYGVSMQEGLSKVISLKI